MWEPQGRAGVSENCCISLVPALWTVPLGIFIPCSSTLVLPAEIVCPRIPTLSSYTQTSCTMDLGITHMGLRISVLLRTVTSLSPFSHPGQWDYPNCLTGWAAEREMRSMLNSILSTNLAFPGWSYPCWSSVSTCGKWFLPITYTWFAARAEASSPGAGPHLLSRIHGVCRQQMPRWYLLENGTALGHAGISGPRPLVMPRVRLETPPCATKGSRGSVFSSALVLGKSKQLRRRKLKRVRAPLLPEKSGASWTQSVSL